MRLSRFGLPLIFLVTMSAAIPASGQAAAPPRVASANATHIFAEMKETKALKETIEAEKMKIVEEGKQRQGEIQQMIQQRNDNINPNHPAWVTASEAIDAKQAEYQAWTVRVKLRADRQQKAMTKRLYDKIESAIAEIAQTRGIDLVIADGRMDLGSIEDMSPQDYARSLNGRVVLFSSKNADITEDVITLLDKNFANAGGAPAPAPAGK